MSNLENQYSAGEAERQPRFVLRPPLHEVLSSPALADDAFMFDEPQRKALQEQVRLRSELAGFTNGFISQLPSPTMELQEAMTLGYISAADLAELYARMSELLRDETATRVVLYMPFEWLPGNDANPDDEALRCATDEFREAYVDAWWSLLREHDARVHYDDGDMRLDVDKNPDELPQVIKAAHLIPFLLKKGIISESDVTYIYDGTNSDVLRGSIDDAMTVYSHRNDQRVDAQTQMPTAPEELHAYHADQLRYMHEERDAGASPQRLEWLQKVAFETTVKAMSVHLDLEGASEYMNSLDELEQSTGCVALGRIAETAIDSDERQHAISLLLDRGSTSMKYYSMTLRRLARVQLVKGADLAVRGIAVPRLHGDLSRNLDIGSREMKVLCDFTQAVRDDTELRQQLYPVVLIGGSRLKGYGDEHSDVDVTICMRPGADESRRTELLDKVMPLLGGEKPHEFWLEEAGQGLAIRLLDTDDQFVGNDHWVHTLFGSAWVGDEATIRDMRSRLLPRYFAEQQYGETNMPLQPAYRKRIEKDVLLYRLLHRGYAHQFPVQGQNIPYAELIDGNGVFYDSGYRQLATQLFIEKVFVPTV